MELQHLIEELSALYPGRKPFISDLLNLLTTTPPAFVHVYDPTTTSYSSKLLTAAFSALKEASYGAPIIFAQVSAFECLTPRLLFDRVLNELADWEPDWENGAFNWAGTLGKGYNGGLDSFMHGLGELMPQVMEKNGWMEQPNILLAFDDAERLRETLPTLLTPLARLSDLTNLPITTIFLSSQPWEEIRPAIGSSVYPYVITLRPLTAEDTTSLLQTHFTYASQTSDPDTLHPFQPVLGQLYQAFASLVQAVCTPYTTSPTEIATVCASVWPLYISPILNDWRAANDRGEEYEIPLGASGRLASMWRGKIAAAAQTIYPRNKSAEEWARENEPTVPLSLDNPAASGFVTTSLSGKEEKPYADLPRMARFLLVASYLCSYNPTRADVRIISKLREDRSRQLRGGGTRKAKVGKVTKLPQSLQGPSSFTLDRLWAVCGALLEVFDDDETRPAWGKTLSAPGAYTETEVTRVQVIGLISELVSQRLLTRITAQEKLDRLQSLKCNLSMAEADDIARGLGMILNKLLWDQQNEQ